MIPRIKNIQPCADYMLLVQFDDDRKVMYDVKEDINVIADFKVLLTEHGLFENVQLDSSRTCVYWNERIDIPSDTIMEYGKQI